MEAPSALSGGSDPLQLSALSASANDGDAPANAGQLFVDAFDYPKGLITNEYAYWNASHPDAVHSPLWEMTSGSLFARSGAGWSGKPDGKSPDADSSPYNDSAVFRLTTKRSDFGDVAVSFKLRNNSLTSTSRTPAVSWDGIHVFLRYQTQYSLYYASINRRDNTSVLKKKVPGGDENGGTYYVLGSSASHTVPYGAWQNVEARIRTKSNGSVTIQLFADGTPVVSATDSGVGGPPITSAGKVGIRGDNCNFDVDDFTVSQL